MVPSTLSGTIVVVPGDESVNLPPRVGNPTLDTHCLPALPRPARRTRRHEFLEYTLVVAYDFIRRVASPEVRFATLAFTQEIRIV